MTSDLRQAAGAEWARQEKNANMTEKCGGDCAGKYTNLYICIRTGYKIRGEEDRHKYL